MKKKYIQPTTRMHSVSTSRMVATSELGFDKNRGTGGNKVTTNDGKDDHDFGW